MLVAGKYKLEKKIGRGGFGSVYLATHIHLPRNAERVVKVINSEIFEADEMLKRFHREVHLTASISQINEHIVHVYDDFGQIPGMGHYYVMEYLRGKTLSDILRRPDKLPSIKLALHIFRQFCEGMEVAHLEGIVHRDLKPDNLMLIQREDDPYFVKILDFGIAKPLEGATPESRPLTAGPIGTPMYMSPEQFLHQTIDTRADVYAMGLILYELLTGQSPFLSGEQDGQYFIQEVAQRHLRMQPLPPRKVRPDRNIPAALEAVVLQALSKEPEKRFFSAREFKNAIDGLGLRQTLSSSELEAFSDIPNRQEDTLQPTPRHKRQTEDVSFGTPVPFHRTPGQTPRQRTPGGTPQGQERMTQSMPLEAEAVQDVAFLETIASTGDMPLGRPAPLPTASALDEHTQAPPVSTPVTIQPAERPAFSIKNVLVVALLLVLMSGYVVYAVWWGVQRHSKVKKARAQTLTRRILPRTKKAAPRKRPVVAPPVRQKTCKDGETRPCFSGPESAKGVGRCRAGVQTCQAEKWSTCKEERLPRKERCNRRDDDCDGRVDESFPKLGKTCLVKRHQCTFQGTWRCAKGERALQCTSMVWRKRRGYKPVWMSISPNSHTFHVTHGRSHHTRKKTLRVKGLSCLELKKKTAFQIWSKGYDRCTFYLRVTKQWTEKKPHRIHMKRRSDLDNATNYCLRSQ
tara:strand:- start:9405 stop:11462 length:2058 start_codon:yes stop_codon:yes gene_type:complete